MTHSTFSLGQTSSILGRTMSLGAAPDFEVVSAVVSGGKLITITLSNPINPSDPLLADLASIVNFAPALASLEVSLTGPNVISVSLGSVVVSPLAAAKYTVSINNALTDVFFQTLEGNSFGFAFPASVDVTRYRKTYATSRQQPVNAGGVDAAVYRKTYSYMRQPARSI